MPDRAAAHTPPTVRGTRFALERVPHLVFFLVVGAAVVRLVHLRSPLCWDMVAVSGLLAVVYAAGMALWHRLGRIGRHAWVLVLLLLWCVLVLLAPAPLTTAYAWCGVPLACAALRALGRRWAAVAVAAITVVLGGQLIRTTGRFDPEMALVPVAAVWGTVALYRAQQRDATERQRLVEQLRSTRDVLAEQQRLAGMLAERTRIARDLHDTLAQELAGSLMLLQAAERDWEQRPHVARTRIRAVADGLDANLAETRRIIEGLTPSAVAEAGLEGSLRLLCAQTGKDGTAAQVRFRSVGDGRPVMDEQAAATLFRVAQSTLANVREHAHAVNVLVTLHHQADRVELEVRDDGVGFDPAEARAATRPSRGFGLPAARARLRECGGDLRVTSAPGRGTRVRAVVPARPASRPLAPMSSATAG
ncbi:sensor histidine kinase [Streptomyces yaanensis]|uniref:Oxygen sensor histidine kinase NreB n=1 Tax=Streptomyces yaanensis TaxID=1142239 RepID=A0ABV7S679_9ACTN|nr:sensor histidine kinase [Streptomyces sp. CGMCC 4.7035]WNB99610.1 sensor histidine kinase [Streptomyces sp. CGMCC 4.7035]